VIFNGLSSADQDGTITSYSWDFGDPSSADNTAVGPTARHTYAATGTFTAQLTVTDNSSLTGVRSGTINVGAGGGNFTLSGHVRILPSSAIDSDVNDVNVPVVRNDTFDTAQALPNPATIGGYLALPGAGVKGAVCAIVSVSNPTCPTAVGDRNDFYQVNLTGNETLLLSIAESAADFDLKLYNDGRVLVDQSVGGMGTESLVVQAAGSYFVDVAAVSGASNYVLSIGQTPVTAAHAPRLSDEFVPGEILIGGNVAPAAKHALHLTDASPGVRRMRFDATRFANARAKARAVARDAKDAEKIATLELMKAVARDPAIAYAEPNYIRRPVATPNDSFYRFQWHYPNIQLPVAWDVIANGSLPNGDGVIVAVVDTGVLLNHPDLRDQILRDASNQVIGYDFISSATRANDGDGIDSNPDDPGDRAFGPNSSSFHGTHVAGTIAAATDNTVGVAGIAWHAKIMPLRALGVDGGTSFDVIQAVRFAAGLSNSSNTVPPQRADVINLSLSGGGSSQSEQATYDAVRNAGVIVVAAAGNEASTLPSYPAAYNGVVSVAATTITKTQATYSNSGSTIDVSAPGGNNATDVNGDGLGDGVVSTIGDDSGGSVQFGYAALSGTSMSAPHVAGVIALMKAIYPALTVAQFETALASGQLTDDLGAIGRDDLFGIGLINAQKAVLRAIELKNGSGTPTSPVLTTSPTSLNFGAFDTELSLEVRNAGGGTLNVTSVMPAEPWLSINPPAPFTLAAGASTTLKIRVDRTTLSDNTYSAQVTLDSNTNDVTVGIVMQVTSLDVEANAGKHYVILIDAATGEAVPQKIAIVDAVNGEYPYTIPSVAAGQYRLAAGTDSDNDNFLCDAGEACGFYRTLDSPDTIVVNGDRADLDFTSGFPVNLFSHSASASGAQPAAVRRPVPVR
jgi:serine protease